MADFREALSGILSGAQRLDIDPWAYAYQARFNPQFIDYQGKEEDALRDVEHYLYARDTAGRGPLGFYQMAFGTPGHAALKALGIKQGDTSVEELLRGWQGAGHGIADWWSGLLGRPSQGAMGLLSDR